MEVILPEINQYSGQKETIDSSADWQLHKVDRLLYLGTSKNFLAILECLSLYFSNP